MTDDDQTKSPATQSQVDPKEASAPPPPDPKAFDEVAGAPLEPLEHPLSQEEPVPRPSTPAEGAARKGALELDESDWTFQSPPPPAPPPAEEADPIESDVEQLAASDVESAVSVDERYDADALPEMRSVTPSRIIFVGDAPASEETPSPPPTDDIQVETHEEIVVDVEALEPPPLPEPPQRLDATPSPDEPVAQVPSVEEPDELGDQEFELAEEVPPPIKQPSVPRPVSMPPPPPSVPARLEMVTHREPPQQPPPVPKPTPQPPPVQTEEFLKRKPRVRPGWEDVFMDDFVRAYPKLTNTQVQGEVKFIEESLGVQKGGVVLDLGCGMGQHAVEMAARGYNIVGYDLSLTMLSIAADEAQERQQRINFLQGDMREMAFEEMFDGVYSWTTSLGFFDDEKNVAVIERVHRALRKGGVFLLDIANRDYICSRLPSLAWFEGDGCVCIDDCYFDAITSRLRVKRTIMLEDGMSKEAEYSVRLYSLHEIGKILHETGFKVLEVSGHPSTAGAFFDTESPRIIALAERK